jgi:hypothetical protein
MNRTVNNVKVAGEVDSEDINLKYLYKMRKQSFLLTVLKRDNPRNRVVSYRATHEAVLGGKMFRKQKIKLE